MKERVKERMSEKRRERERGGRALTFVNLQTNPLVKRLP